MSDVWLTVWTPLTPRAYLRRPASELPFPLGEPGCRLYLWGRHAIWHGLKALGLGPGDEVLAPAYHHGSEIEAIERAGVRCRFYDGGEALEPDAAELEEALTPDVRALYLTHYLGFAQDVPRWRRWCDDRGLLLLEDVAMAWLASFEGRPLGSWGDLAAFSPWKPFGLPDMGALLCSAPAPEADGRRPLAAGHVLRNHAAWFAQRWSWLARLRWRTLRETEFDRDAGFALRDPEEPPSASSGFLLRRLCDTDVAARRRENHSFLLQALRDRVPPPFDQTGDGACPFFFPVVTDDKQALLERLGSHGVRGLDIWSVPHRSLPVDRFPQARRRRETTVGLPVHQELRREDLERIAAAAA
jgi:dTDP-4-amino-4,6-dideoxygalactose transaminase